MFFCIPGADDGDVPLGPPGDTFQTVLPGGLWPQHPIFDSDAMADSVLTAGAPGGIGAPPVIVTAADAGPGPADPGAERAELHGVRRDSPGHVWRARLR